MPILTDPLSGDARLLLRTVAKGFAEGRAGGWPIWQWVHRQLEDQEVDPVQTLWSLPNWTHNYGPVLTKHGPRSIPGDDEPVALSVHGIHHAGHPATELLSRGFLAAIAIAGERVREQQPTPWEPVRVVIDGGALTVAANLRAGSNLSEGQLYGLLGHEPAAWAGLSGDEPGWTWDATRANLSRYRGVTGTSDYLTVLNDVVGGTPNADGFVTEQDFHPLALPDALDHLNLTWRSLTGKPLLQLRRAASVGKLVVPVTTRDEFDSRCSALADILNGLAVAGEEKGSLHRLELRLGDTWQVANLERAQAAARTLRHLVALRAGQQHGGADSREVRARLALGLDRFGGDWPYAWERVRSAAVLSLNAIREELEPLLSD